MVEAITTAIALLIAALAAAEFLPAPALLRALEHPGEVAEATLPVLGKAAAGADLALVDVMLAGQSSGIEAAAVLKDRYGIPSLFITAMVPDLAEARVTGLGYLSKPFTDEDLLRSLDAVMAKLEGRKPLSVPANLTLFA